MNSVRLSPDVAPIFFADVFVDLDWRAAVQRVAAAALGAGYPIIVARLDAVVVGFEASALEALECPAMVIESAASLGKRDTANPRRPSEPTGFAFDVHDAPCLRFHFARG